MPRRGNPVKRLEQRYTHHAQAATWLARDAELHDPFMARIMRPMLNRLQGAGSALTSKRERQGLQDLLQQAGYPGGMSIRQLQGIKVLLMLLLPLVMLLFLWVFSRVFGLDLMVPVVIIAVGAVGAMIGYISLPFILRNMIKKRQKQIRRNLPDVFDLITIAVEAGLGFDAAMDRVGQRYQGPMGEELLRTTNDIRMGRPWSEAMRDLADRSGVEEVRGLVTALVQARELGVNLGNVLRAQSQRLREERSRKAREAAQKAPTKLIFPLVLFIFPTLFIVLIGPAALKATKVLKESDVPGFSPKKK